MQSLKGRTAIVTGAGKGIGKAIAIALADQGVHLALVSRTKEDLEEIKLSIDNPSVQVSCHAADIAHYGNCEKVVEDIKRAIGPVDILINNAGITRFGTMLDMDIRQWEEIIQVNLLGMYYMSRLVLPDMLAGGIGDIVNIGSKSGKQGSADSSAYSASKFAVHGFSQSLHKEVAKSNIRVCAINPGMVATEYNIARNKTDGNPDKVLQPEDIAALIIAQLKFPRRVIVESLDVSSSK